MRLLIKGIWAKLASNLAVKLGKKFGQKESRPHGRFCNAHETTRLQICQGGLESHGNTWERSGHSRGPTPQLFTRFDSRATHARTLMPAALASVPIGFVLVQVRVRVWFSLGKKNESASRFSLLLSSIS